MLERELDIFFYHGRHGVKRLFTYRRWMFLAPLVVLAVSVAGGVVLWRSFDGCTDLACRIDAVRARLADQKAQGLALRERARLASIEATRIAAFDAKLTVMLARPGETAGMGSLPTAVGLPEPPGRRFLDYLDALGERLAVEEVRQQELSRSLFERKLEFLAKPSLWPLRGDVTSGFGSRISPFGRHRDDFHNGVDIRTAMGSPVHAPGAGRVVEADYVNGYGLRVVIAHDFGLETVFAHLKKAEVKPGQMVKRGELIGLSGNSGRTTGSHLHYEVHVNGTPVNPRQYMLD